MEAAYAKEVVDIELDLHDIRIRKEPVELHETVHLSDIPKESTNVQGIGPVDTQVTAAFAGRIYQVNGNVQTQVTYICSRCLDAFTANLRTGLEERFTDDSSKADDEVHEVRGDNLFLDPYVEQALWLALDYRPLCSEHCKGLCPTCGANWNHTSCSCDNRSVDPRLSALEGLRFDDPTE